MRTSHAEIKNRILTNVRDKDPLSFFSSEQYRAYLMDRVEQMRPAGTSHIKVLLDYPNPNGAVAYTDGREIHIQPSNRITQSFPTMYLQHVSMMGLLAHEMGHVLFSNFTMLGLFQNSLENASFYPEEPTPSNTSQILALDEIKKYLLSEEGQEEYKYKRVILFALKQIVNCLEDVYIESCMCFTFPGDVKNGILLNQHRLLEQSKSIQEMMNEKINAFPLMMSLVLQYARQGDIYNPEEYKGEYLDILYQCIPYIDSSLYSEDVKDRFSSAHQVLLFLWKFAKKYVDELPEEELDQMEEELHKLSPSEDPIGSGDPCMESAGYFDRDSEGEINRSIQEVIAYETGKAKLMETTLEESEEIGSIMENPLYEGANYLNCLSDLHRLLNTFAEERVGIYEAEELTEELQKLANEISLGNAHKGESILIHRLGMVPERLIQDYQAIYPSLRPTVEKLIQEISSLVDERRKGGKRYNCYQGNRFEAKRCFRKNGAYFSKKNLPTKGTDLAVAVLVDESGSMSSGDRITSAKASSLVLEAFCRKLKIPCMIAGHTYGDEVDIYSYVDFQSRDPLDPYRIMDMTARYSNRDGAALRYVAERLEKRPEKYRVLLLLSDGAPAADDYEGTAAEADLRGIKQEYEKKGIRLLAGAIGDDEHVLTRIYGNSYVDLTDLKKLPKNLTKLLIPYIREEV